MLRYPYLFSLPYKLIRDVLKKIQDKGMVSQNLFQGNFRGKGKSPVGSVVQWFSGMLFCRTGSALQLFKLFGVKVNRRRFKQGGGGWDRNRLGLGIGLKGREGVTRLIKLFYQSKLQNLQVQNSILNKIFSTQINFYT